MKTGDPVIKFIMCEVLKIRRLSKEENLWNIVHDFKICACMTCYTYLFIFNFILHHVYKTINLKSENTVNETYVKIDSN